jgi:hypothetical protein
MMGHTLTLAEKRCELMVQRPKGDWASSIMSCQNFTLIFLVLAGNPNPSSGAGGKKSKDLIWRLNGF